MPATRVRPALPLYPVTVCIHITLARCSSDTPCPSQGTLYRPRDWLSLTVYSLSHDALYPSYGYTSISYCYMLYSLCGSCCPRVSRGLCGRSCGIRWCVRVHDSEGRCMQSAPGTEGRPKESGALPGCPNLLSARGRGSLRCPPTPASVVTFHDRGRTSEALCVLTRAETQTKSHCP
jgi:hypothetical protein